MASMAPLRTTTMCQLMIHRLLTFPLPLRLLDQEGWTQPVVKHSFTLTISKSSILFFFFIFFFLIFFSFRSSSGFCPLCSGREQVSCHCSGLPDDPPASQPLRGHPQGERAPMDLPKQRLLEAAANSGCEAAGNLLRDFPTACFQTIIIQNIKKMILKKISILV